MKVHELLEKKLDEMNIQDYNRLVVAIGAQLGIILIDAGILDIDAIGYDKVMPAVMDLEIMQVGKCEYGILCDAKALRMQLIG